MNPDSEAFQHLYQDCQEYFLQYIEILSPRAEEVWTEGDIREICWDSFGVEKV